ncbi:MAG: CvpA family protein [Bacteroidales bacterium]|jgi:membrane protein required for colicin V production|nr:CvpA family protein [Bacteroidales bacterium]
MRIVDVIILIAIIWFAIKGFRKGFIDGTFSFLALIIGGWATVYFTDYTCSLFHWNSDTKWLLAAGITFIVVFVAVLIIGKVCKSIFNFILPEFFDKMLGLILGGGKVLLFFGIMFYLISHIDTNERIISSDNKRNSFFYTPSVTVAKVLLPQFGKLKDSKLFSEETKK